MFKSLVIMVCIALVLVTVFGASSNRTTTRKRTTTTTTSDQCGGPDKGCGSPNARCDEPGTETPIYDGEHEGFCGCDKCCNKFCIL